MKTGLEEILKRLQKINKQIRYQIRLGKSDLELFMKNHEDHMWKPFRRVEISVVDPNEEVPKWDLTVSNKKYVPDTENPFDITKNPRRARCYRVSGSQGQETVKHRRLAGVRICLGVPGGDENRPKL